MRNPRTIKRIGVFGHVGNANLGDEAIIAAVVQNIKQRYSDAAIYGFTINPEDTQKRHNIQAFPIRRPKKIPTQREHSYSRPSDRSPLRQPSTPMEQFKAALKRLPLFFALLKCVQQSVQTVWGAQQEVRFLLHCFKHLKGIDLLIIAGSHQLIDYLGGPWAFPYTLIKWVLLARIVKAKVAFVSVGAGPIHSAVSRFFIKKALTLAHYRSYRDEGSKQVIEQLGVPGPYLVCPDLVYSLPIEEKPHTTPPERSAPVVGINPVPFSDPEYWPGSSTRIYKMYVRKLADFARWLIQQGYAVLFFPTQLRLDPPVIHDIRMAMKADGARDVDGSIVDWPIHTFDDLVAALAMTDMIVATRFHGVVLPYRLGKPLLGIAYHRKTRELMEDMGQSYYTLDIIDFDLNALQERFTSLASRRAKLGRVIQQKVAAYGQALEAQYDQIFALIEKR